MPVSACLPPNGIRTMNDMTLNLADEAAVQRLADALALQRKAYLEHPVPTLAERQADLRTLQRFVRENKEALIDAISADYGHRSRHETLLAEIVPVIDGIGHTLKHLKGWMKPQRRSVDWITFFGARNRAIVKMSENSRHLAKLLIERMPAYFPPEKLQFFDETGGVGIEFSKLPFDHLLFTGSTHTGRSVMAAAARNLCPVTLELGGKAPAIVFDDYPLRTAAERILFAKLLNAGQICTTVDHAWLPQGSIDAFVKLACEIVPQRYPRLDSPDYTSVIDERSFDRLVHALDEARERGATLVQLVPGPAHDRATRKIAPHIVLNAPDDCLLMQREIFGPILPLRGYDSVDAVIARINAGPRPLAVYPFSLDGARVQKVLDHVMSGGVSVNDAVLHVGQHDLPFGGVGASGMGHYHGREGFETFSKLRPVFYQARMSSLKFLMPPYGKFADRMLAFLSK
jgi:coniferyl-aldehyde dehydrogenase